MVVGLLEIDNADMLGAVGVFRQDIGQKVRRVSQKVKIKGAVVSIGKKRQRVDIGLN